MGHRPALLHAYGVSEATITSLVDWARDDTVALGFPLAYLITHLRPAMAAVVLVLVLLPFWTSLLVRTTAWYVLLQPNGVVNSLLVKTGLTSAPVPLTLDYRIPPRYGLDQDRDGLVDSITTPTQASPTAWTAIVTVRWPNGGLCAGSYRWTMWEWTGGGLTPAPQSTGS